MHISDNQATVEQIWISRIIYLIFQGQPRFQILISIKNRKPPQPRDLPAFDQCWSQADCCGAAHNFSYPKTKSSYHS